MFSTDLLADLFAKGTALLLLFILLERLLCSASAAVRHRLWGACFFALLLLPVFVLLMPQWRMAILPTSWSSIAARDTKEQAPLISSNPSDLSSSLNDGINTANEKDPFLLFDLNPMQEEAEQAVSASIDLHKNDLPRSFAPHPEASKGMIEDHWTPSFSTIVWIGWSFGALVVIWPLLSGLARNGSIQKRSQRVEAGEIANLFAELCNLLTIKRLVQLRQSSMSIVPMTWGILNPVVIVPVDFRGWTPDSRRLVLLHELAHVKRLDVLYQSIARTVLALYWFHPLVWYALRQLRIERELACDDCVLALCDRPSRYAKQLLDIARRYQMSALPPAVAMAHRSGLEKRVRSLLDRAKSHRPIGPLASRTMLIGSVMATMILSVVRFEAAETMPTTMAKGVEPELQEKSPIDGKSNRVVGRVLDPNLKPIANARVVVIRVYQANTSWTRTPEWIAEIKSDANGNYQFDIPNQTERFSDGMHIEVSTVSIAATADGFGPAEVLVEEPAKNVDLVLAPATKAIEGRIVDLEGKPVEGVRVRVTEVVGSPIPLSEWIEAAQANPSTHDNMTMAAPPLGKSGPPRLAYFPAKDPVQSTGILNLPEATTDKEGRFKIHGMGDDRLVTMRLDSPKISSSFLQAVTRKMETVNMPSLDPRQRSGKIFGETFVCAAEPTQVIKGILRDKQSQKPIVGATVELSQYSDNLLSIEQFLVAKTDARGRYELVGVPKVGEGQRSTKLRVVPPSDEPYFRSEWTVPKKSGLGPIELNIELTQSQWIEGKVVDSKTDEPIRSMVAYYPYLDNPNAKGHEAFDSGLHSMGYGEMFPTDQEGNYRVPGLNGKGMLRVIQLSGGNDGLNTVVPFKDDGYLSHRKGLRLKESELIKIDPQIGLHPSMRGMADLLDAGKLAIVQGVGYPEPSRSHDVSMAVWQTGRIDPEEHSGYGWLGRALDQTPNDSQTPNSMLVSDAGAPIALRSRKSKMGAMTSLEEFKVNHPRPILSIGSSTNSLFEYMQRSTLEAYATADQIQSILDESNTKRASSLSRIGTPLANSLKMISDLIQANMGTRVYYAMQNGYDTHALQLQTHQSLLSDLSRSLKAFLEDLMQGEQADRVMVLCFSEFGRQIKENASGGTDYGTAGVLFLAGNGVRSGLHGQVPNLQSLDQNAPKFTVDFRSVYRTILKNWLEVEPDSKLNTEASLRLVDVIKLS